MAGVRAALDECRAQSVFIDERDVLTLTLELRVGRMFGGRLGTASTAIEMEAVSAAYLRPYGAYQARDVAAAGPGSDAWNHALAFEQSMWTWAEHTRARVVNRLSAMASNGSKPFQASTIRRCGFRSPETLITTDPESAREFIERHEAVVYKSISGVRSIVSRVGCDQMSRLDDVRWCPTQFQEYVSGTDYRVHVVGDELFCMKIESDADDYRYAFSTGHRCDMTVGEVPDHVAESCRRVTRELGLLFSGIDLRRTADGDWFCFEVNPSPGFTCFDTDAHDIARAVADLLVRVA